MALTSVTNNTIMELLSEEDIGQELIERTMLSGIIPQILERPGYSVADDFSWVKMPIATFEDEAWPDATVKVWSEQRNIGPNAPYPVLHYRIEAGGRFTEWMRNRDACYQTASDLHVKLVAGLVALQKEVQPNYGRF